MQTRDKQSSLTPTYRSNRIKTLVTNLIQMSLMSKTTAAYVAGYVDGEGYLGIMKRNKNKDDRLRADFLPTIKVTSVDKGIIYWFKDSFGGWISKRDFPSSPNSRTAYTWTLAGQNIEKFLQTIYPYLRGKRPQAKLLLERLKLYKRKGEEVGKGSGCGSNFKYSELVYKKIEDLHNQVKSLNHRGLVQSERLNQVTL